MGPSVPHRIFSCLATAKSGAAVYFAIIPNYMQHVCVIVIVSGVGKRELLSKHKYLHFRALIAASNVTSN